jgi:hypothetical protein
MEQSDLRRMVWEEMLYARMRADYFGELVRHYLNWDKALRVFVLLASSGAFASVLAAAPKWLSLGFPSIATAGSFWLLFSQYGMLARDATDLHEGWNSLATEYERLWNHLDDLGAEGAFDRIYAKGDNLSKMGTRFPNKKRRLEFWLDHAAQLATARYA